MTIYRKRFSCHLQKWDFKRVPGAEIPSLDSISSISLNHYEAQGYEVRKANQPVNFRPQKLTHEKSKSLAKIGIAGNVDISTARQYGGTGLGLAISHRLAEMMNGRMWVESEEKKGSTFPFVIQANPADLEKRAEEVAASQLSGKRILIVEDNATNGQILTNFTERLG